MASQKFKSKIQADAGVQITGTSGSKALQLDASGNIQESTVTTAELAQLAGVSSAVVTVDGTQTLTNKTLTAPAISSPTGLVKADVGLSNVDNTSDATKNAATATLTNKTLTAPVINSPTGIVKGDVGLGNVDNTSDATKDAATATLTNKTLTAPVINSPTGIVKGDVGLGNVDNTSDATKNSATATLTNKTIDASSNTISNLTVAMLASGVLDTDLSSVSASDDTIPSAKATRAYIISQVGAGAIAGDISLTSFSAANNQAAAASVTGLAFAAGVTRSFKAQVSVAIDATAELYEAFELIGIQKAAGFEMSVSSVGDDSGIVFSITSAGQVEYTSTNVSGFASNTIKFRASTTTI